MSATFDALDSFTMIPPSLFQTKEAFVILLAHSRHLSVLEDSIFAESPQLENFYFTKVEISRRRFGIIKGRFPCYNENAPGWGAWVPNQRSGSSYSPFTVYT